MTSTQSNSDVGVWRTALPEMKGRTITGYATGALGDRLTGLTLTFDDGSWAMLVARYDREGEIAWTQVEHHAGTDPEIGEFRDFLRRFSGGQWARHADATPADLADAIAQAKEWIGGRRYSWKTVAAHVLEDGRPHA